MNVMVIQSKTGPASNRLVAVMEVNDGKSYAVQFEEWLEKSWGDMPRNGLFFEVVLLRRLK